MDLGTVFAYNIELRIKKKTKEATDFTDYTEKEKMSEYKYEQLTGQIINAAHTVHNTLGYGFLEKIYQNSLLRIKKSRPSG